MAEPTFNEVFQQEEECCATCVYAKACTDCKHKDNCKGGKQQNGGCCMYVEHKPVFVKLNQKACQLHIAYDNLP